MRMFAVLVCLLILCYFEPTSNLGTITIEEGGYQGILINFKDEVDFEEGMVNTLKEQLIDASRVLYEATLYNYGTDRDTLRYFSQATIILPGHWPDHPELDFCTKATTEDRSKAHFVIDNDSAQYKILPHTPMSSSECGREQSGQINIPKSFLTDTKTAEKIFGKNLGKVLVHEWSHKRYGLFDESTAKEGKFNCEVPAGSSGIKDHIPVRCSVTIGGRTRNDNEHGCYFTHTEKDSEEARGSIMFYGPEFLPKVETFCDGIAGEHDPTDSVKHDFDVNHDHNRLCQGKTGWEILREHLDFSNHQGPAFDLDKDFEADLDFHCVRLQTDRRIVLIMDISGSMNDENRLERMRSDVALFLNNLFTSGTNVEVGMVEFSTNSKILSYLVPLNTQADLDELISKIPPSANGWTCIGCGINSGIEILENGGEEAAGGELFVFTDGEETTAPTIKEVHDTVLSKQVIVYGLLLISVIEEHDLVVLSVESGGEACIYDDDGTDYYDCLNSLYKLSSGKVMYEIKRDDLIVPSGQSEEGTVDVDSSFDEHLRLTLTWTSTLHGKKANTFKSQIAEPENEIIEKIDAKMGSGKAATCDLIDMKVIMPDGTIIDDKHPGYDKNVAFGTITIQSHDHTAGNWQYEVINPSSQVCSGTLRVEGFASNNGTIPDMERPLAMSYRISDDIIVIDKDKKPLDNALKLFVHLQKGSSPVLDANVHAHIESDDAEWDVKLMDNGAGADVHVNDGIYSRYFFQYDKDSMYHVRFFANGTEGQTGILQEERFIQEIVDEDDNSTYIINKTSIWTPYENFERSAMGGMFEVQGVPQDDIGSLFPPAQIIDLHVLEQNDNVSVLLAWTAVGESLDHGKASYYDMRVGSSAVELFENFTYCKQVNESDIIVGSLISPLPSGEQEMMVIDSTVLIDDEFEDFLNGTYYLGIQAVDPWDNNGVTSNVAVIRVFAPDPVAPEPETPSPSVIDPPDDGGGVGLIVIIVGVMFLSVLIAGFVMVVRNKKSTSQEESQMDRHNDKSASQEESHMDRHNDRPAYLEELQKYCHDNSSTTHEKSQKHEPIVNEMSDFV